MRGPLKGIAVVDLGLGPVTGLATMVLADFGAEVIKVEPPGGDPFRAMPSSKTWLRGKSTLEVDFDDRKALDDLRSLILDGADAVVTTFDRERRRALGLDYVGLSSTRRDLVYGVVSGFGEDGPYSDYAAVEAVVAAKFGRMMSLEGVAPPPGSFLRRPAGGNARRIASGRNGAACKSCGDFGGRGVASPSRHR